MKAWWSFASALGGAAVMWLALAGGTSGPTASATTSVATSPPARVTVVNRPAAADRSSIDVATLRAAIRDELAAASKTMPETAEAPPAPTSAQVAAAEAAMAVVEHAVATGRWTPADEEQLKTMADRLHPDAHTDVLLAWAQAVNDQKLTIP